MEVRVVFCERPMKDLLARNARGYVSGSNYRTLSKGVGPRLDHGAAGPLHPSMKYRGDEQRELPVQEPILIRQARTVGSGQYAVA